MREVRANQSRRGDGEGGADRLREPFRRAGRVAVPDVESRRDDPRRESPSGSGFAPVRTRATNRTRAPAAATLLECDGDDASTATPPATSRAERLVDGFGKEALHSAHATRVDRPQVVATARSRRCSATPRAAARASRPASRSSRFRFAHRSPGSARICTDRLRASSRARSACRGAAAPARRFAAGSSSTRTPSTRRSSAPRSRAATPGARRPAAATGRRRRASRSSASSGGTGSSSSSARAHRHRRRARAPAAARARGAHRLHRRALRARRRPRRPAARTRRARAAGRTCRRTSVRLDRALELVHGELARASSPSLDCQTGASTLR